MGNRSNAPATLKTRCAGYATCCKLASFFLPIGCSRLVSEAHDATAYRTLSQRGGSVLHIKLEKDEDGVFIATVPSMPGCISDGPTREEAIVNVRDAIQGWLAAEDEKALSRMPEAERASLITQELLVA